MACCKGACLAPHLMEAAFQSDLAMEEAKKKQKPVGDGWPMPSPSAASPLPPRQGLPWYASSFLCQSARLLPVCAACCGCAITSTSTARRVQASRKYSEVHREACTTSSAPSRPLYTSAFWALAITLTPYWFELPFQSFKLHGRAVVGAWATLPGFSPRDVLPNNAQPSRYASRPLAYPPVRGLEAEVGERRKMRKIRG